MSFTGLVCDGPRSRHLGPTLSGQVLGRPSFTASHGPAFDYHLRGAVHEMV
ncbi:hypothetical protein SGL43_00219 [Streptomyces globisporus]|uniref:AraC family transcriptional regulator n=1 Tax=Streptomyces globisporus TaxID=1908 RepID=A0ABM9GPD2_STRGL|nr:hypothetical protein SGL43_00219 [Streptomyces globisporus]